MSEVPFRPLSRRDGYLPIEDHGCIGDGSTVALVGRDGALSWLCLPRFDSPPLFCSILDRTRGGSFQLGLPEIREARQFYEEDTPILHTEIRTPTGLLRVTDALTLHAGADLNEDVRAGRRELVRRLRVIEGDVDVRLEISPRGGAEHSPASGGIEIRCAARGDLELHLDASIPLDGLRTPVRIRSGETVDVTLRWNAGSGRHKSVTAAQAVAQTADVWRHWITQFRYDGPQTALVRRSAITLKILDHFENGAIVAAPTSSLPEAIGGVRNWDYRYAWIRDAALSVYALHRIGYSNEAARFLAWVLDAVERDGAPKVLYDIDGRQSAPEWTDTEIEGYRRSAPVRWGNGAADQRQNDAYGEILDCAYQWAAHHGKVDEALWRKLHALVETARHVWHEPDHGIWEVRTSGRTFTYSAAMCEVALDRGARLAERFGLPGDVAGWRAVSETIRSNILHEAWDEKLQSLTEHLGGGGLDASLLALPLRRVIAADHPRMVATTAAQAEPARGGRPEPETHPSLLLNTLQTWTAELTAIRVLNDQRNANRTWEGSTLTQASERGVMSLILETIQTEGIAQLSYLVGDDGPGRAAVIDPRPDVEVYVELARNFGLAITHIFETHIHADFVSGSRELAERVTPARIHVSVEGGATYGFQHEPIKDGASFEFGQVTLTARHTPGHTPEHMSYMACETKRAPTPWGVFTGDSLFVNSAGRPDLMGDDQVENLAEQLHDTLYSFFLALDNEVIIYPGHGQGSPCGADIGDRLTSTIGYERRYNPFLQHPDQRAFKDFVMSTAPPEPTYYKRMKQINAAGPEVLGSLPSLRGLRPAAFRASGGTGEVVVVDTRSMLAFGGGHIAGALNIGGSPELSIWAGWLLDPAKPAFLVLDRDEDGPEVVSLLLRIGFTNVAGYLLGGMTAWAKAGFELAAIDQMDVHELKAHADDLAIVDVRSPGEWKKGCIPGAVNLFLPEVQTKWAELDKQKPVAVYCNSGYRASIASSMLKAEGFDVSNVPGSWQAWVGAGFPVEPGTEEVVA